MELETEAKNRISYITTNVMAMEEDPLSYDDIQRKANDVVIILNEMYDVGSLPLLAGDHSRDTIFQQAFGSLEMSNRVGQYHPENVTTLSHSAAEKEFLLTRKGLGWLAAPESEIKGLNPEFTSAVREATGELLGYGFLSETKSAEEILVEE